MAARNALLSSLVMAMAGAAVAGVKIPAEQLTVPLVYTNQQGATIPYRFAAPKMVKPGKKYPLVIYFHGAGERGVNNVSQLILGVPDILNYMREKKIEGYLCSPAAAYIHGAIIPVDGGWLAR